MLSAAAQDFVGRLEITDDVGLVKRSLTTELQWTIRSDFDGFPPMRTVTGHKGSLRSFGDPGGQHGLSRRVSSCPRAERSKRAQPGLVTLYTSESVYQVVAAQLQAVMVSPWQPGLQASGDMLRHSDWTRF
jgi:hypothetical protein